MYGQQMERCRAVLNSYDERQLVVAVNVSMNTLEVMTAERQPGNHMRLSTTTSKNSPGFQLLVRLLSTPKANLGYATPLMPAIKRLGRHRLEVHYLVHQGSPHQGYGSWVFRVKLEPDVDAVLKLNRISQEVNKLPITMHTNASISCLRFACGYCVPCSQLSSVACILI